MLFGVFGRRMHMLLLWSGAVLCKCAVATSTPQTDIYRRACYYRLLRCYATNKAWVDTTQTTLTDCCRNVKTCTRSHTC